MLSNVSYGVYDMKYYEQCVGVFENYKQLSRFLDKTPNTLASACCRNSLVNYRYLIVRIKNEQ